MGWMKTIILSIRNMERIWGEEDLVSKIRSSVLDIELINQQLLQTHSLSCLSQDRRDTNFESLVFISLIFISWEYNPFIGSLDQLDQEWLYNSVSGTLLNLMKKIPLTFLHNLSSLCRAWYNLIRFFIILCPRFFYKLSSWWYKISCSPIKVLLC